MRVSIVIPAYNAAATLDECLSACTRQTYPDCEVIVVDDGSTDATSDIVRRFPITYIRRERGGPAAARNMGAKKAAGEVLAFTDSDCVPHPEWIARLVNAIDEGCEAAGGTYGIANPGKLLAKIIHEEIQLRHSAFGKRVDFLGTFNLAIRRDAFERVHGFDEKFDQASAEDNDLSYRMIDAGYRMCFVPEAIVDHYHPTRLVPYLRTQARHGFWRVILYMKHRDRLHGDKYAGRPDLVRPFAALAIIAVLGLSSAGYNLDMLSGGLAVLALVLLLASYVETGIQLCLRARDLRLLASIPFLAIRDVARALGSFAILLRRARNRTTA